MLRGEEHSRAQDEMVGGYGRPPRFAGRETHRHHRLYQRNGISACQEVRRSRRSCIAYQSRFRAREESSGWAESPGEISQISVAISLSLDQGYNITHVSCDLMDLESVRAAAAALNTLCDAEGLDVLGKKSTLATLLSNHFPAVAVGISEQRRNYGFQGQPNVRWVRYANANQPSVPFPAHRRDLAAVGAGRNSPW